MYYSDIRNGVVLNMSFWSMIGLADKKEINRLQDSLDSLIEENKLLRKDNAKLYNYLSEVRENLFEEIAIKTDHMQDRLSSFADETNSQIHRLSTHIEKSQNEIDKTFRCQVQELFEEISKCQLSIETMSGKLEKQIMSCNDDIMTNSKSHKDMLLDRMLDLNNLSMENNKKIYAELSKHGIELDSSLQSLYDMQKSISSDICKVNEMLEEDEGEIKRISEIANSVESKTNSLPELEQQTRLLAESLHNLWTINKAIWVDSVLSDLQGICDKQEEGLHSASKDNEKVEDDLDEGQKFVRTLWGDIFKTIR